MSSHSSVVPDLPLQRNLTASRISCFSGFLFCFILLIAPLLFAEGEILIGEVQLTDKAVDRYSLSAPVTNTTGDPREVTLRGLISFYDRTSPMGDIPVMQLRKDITLILRPGEERQIDMNMIAEGSLPAGALRKEALVRLRRQRVWHY